MAATTFGRGQRGDPERQSMGLVLDKWHSSHDWFEYLEQNHFGDYLLGGPWWLVNTYHGQYLHRGFTK